MYFINKILAFGLLTVIHITSSATQFTAIKATSGCEINFEGNQHVSEASYDWQGDCVGGKAQGIGTLVLTLALKDHAPTVFAEYRQTRNAGTAFGYMTVKTRFSKKAPELISFVGAGYPISFTRGWGLSLDGLSVGGPVMNLPAQAPVEAIPYMSIIAGNRRIYLSEAPCLLYHDRVSGCSSAESQDRMVYEINESEIFETGTTIPGKKILCPDPFSISSCAPLIEKLSRPLRDEILFMLRQSKPYVDETLEKLSLVSGVAISPRAQSDNTTRNTDNHPPAAMPQSQGAK
jgi:hypothetical protein